MGVFIELSSLARERQQTHMCNLQMASMDEDGKVE
jgi:hypothetical protein